MAALPEFLETCEDRYRLASLDLSGFTVYTLLRGFENSMVDFLTEPERFAWLMDLILDFECEHDGDGRTAGISTASTSPTTGARKPG